jgi:hypothetical protein
MGTAPVRTIMPRIGSTSRRDSDPASKVATPAWSCDRERVKMIKLFVGLATLVPVLAACGGDDSTTAAGGAGGSGGSGGSTGSTQECTLINDSGGPGQYADACVKREWVEPYAGTYTSPNCTLTITTPSGGPAAVFELELTDAALGGTFTHDWEGGTGAGNDSYYVFTTDDTFTTTKAINFGVGQKVSDTEERSIRFRINDIDTGTPSYTGGFQVTITSPFSNTEADCGVLTPEK